LHSVATPAAVRAEWAFKVFDYDGDSLLSGGDIRSVGGGREATVPRMVVDAITGSEPTALTALSEEMRQKVVKNVLK
jgi:Ca2+-binding EF-hand superfamily protein